MKNTDISKNSIDNREVCDTDFNSCPNCGHGNIEQFCAKCGQNNKDFNKPIKEVAKDFFDTFNLDKRIVNTLIPFFFRPGFLTQEYFRGHRKRYVSPMRLYLFISFLFFLLMSIDSDDNGKLMSDSTNTTDSLKLDIIQVDSVKNINKAYVSVDFGNQSDTTQNSFERTLKDVFSKEKLSKISKTEFKGKYQQYFSYLMFILMPFFALLLKMLYIRRKKFYAHHLIFSINLHSFAFGVFSLLIVIDYILGDQISEYFLLLFFGIPVYMIVGMRKFYNQSYWKTILKALVLSLFYFVVVAVSLLIILIITILMINS